MTSNQKRDEKVLSKWKQGIPMTEIGKSFRPALSRQNVYQILKRMGYQDLPNVRKKKSRAKKVEAVASKAQRQNDRDIKRYGMSTEEIKATSTLERSDPKHPLSLYRTWEKNVKPLGNNGVDFRVWWDIWQKSGHWEERGRGHGYWMARVDPTKPFAPDNIMIKTGVEVRTKNKEAND